MPEPETESLWRSTTYEFDLRDVELVATFGQDGGGLTERPAKLACTEGRLETYTYHQGKRLNRLEYHFGFAESDEPDPIASASSQARIVITGVHENGLSIEIRGNGWVGYDDKGNLEGRFDHPPIIITEDDDLEDEPERQPTDEEILSGIDFPMPPKYNRATTRVSDWSDFD